MTLFKLLSPSIACDELSAAMLILYHSCVFANCVYIPCCLWFNARGAMYTLILCPHTVCFLDSDEFQWLLRCKCAAWLLQQLHLAWHLIVYCLVVCRSGANAVKAEIKAEEVKTEDGQTEVCTCGHCITMLNSLASLGLHHVCNFNRQAPVLLLCCSLEHCIEAVPHHKQHSLQSSSVLQVKAEPVVQAAAQDDGVKAEARQHQHEEDDDTGSEGDSDEDEEYEVSVLGCGQAVCNAQCTPAAVYS